jgi:hypothetical protein
MKSKKGIVITKKHPILYKGQDVNIVDEEDNDYWVRGNFDNPPRIRISKKDLEIN